MNLLWIFIFFPSLASASMILILEIAGPSWVPTCSTVSCLLIFWECGSPPPQIVTRGNVSFLVKQSDSPRSLMLDVYIYRSWLPYKHFLFVSPGVLDHTKETCWGMSMWGDLLMINPSSLSGHCCRQHGFLKWMWEKMSQLNRSCS